MSPQTMREVRFRAEVPELEYVSWPEWDIRHVFKPGIVLAEGCEYRLRVYRNGRVAIHQKLHDLGWKEVVDCKFEKEQSA